MLNELEDADVNLIDEHHVQAIIISLSHNWEYMKVYLTHNVNIKIMVDASRHLELEKNRIKASKPNIDIYVMRYSSKSAPWFKRKFSRKGKK